MSIHLFQYSSILSAPPPPPYVPSSPSTITTRVILPGHSLVVPVFRPLLRPPLTPGSSLLPLPSPGHSFDSH